MHFLNCEYLNHVYCSESISVPEKKCKCISYHRWSTHYFIQGHVFREVERGLASDTKFLGEGDKILVVILKNSIIFFMIYEVKSKCYWWYFIYFSKVDKLRNKIWSGIQLYEVQGAKFLNTFIKYINIMYNHIVMFSHHYIPCVRRIFSTNVYCFTKIVFKIYVYTVWINYTYYVNQHECARNICP